MANIVFKEEQKYKQGRGLLLIFPFWIVFLIGMGIAYYQKSMGQEGDQNNIAIVFFIFLGVAIIQSFIFMRLTLKTEIHKDGIYFKYPPLINKWKQIPFTNIKSYEMREYRPIREYGGHGINVKRHAYKRRKWGISYTAYGNTGLQLKLKNGKNTLIGTQRANAIMHALEKLKIPKNNS